MKHGFVLMEVLIALAVSSMLTGLLFMTITQVTQGVRAVDDVMDIQSRTILAVRQFERDIMGVMVPPQEKNQPKQPPQKKLTKIFFSSTKDTNCELLTFITNNPLQRSWIGSSGVLAPRMVRVVYRLVLDKTVSKAAEKRYVLTRQEAQELDFDLVAKDAGENKNKFRAYEMIDGIAQFKVTYKPHQSEDKKDEKKQEKKVITAWDSDSKLEGDKERPADQIVPGIVQFELVLADSQRGKHTLHLSVPIIPDMTSSTTDQVSTPTVQNQGALPS